MNRASIFLTIDSLSVRRCLRSVAWDSALLFTHPLFLFLCADQQSAQQAPSPSPRYSQAEWSGTGHPDKEAQSMSATSRETQSYNTSEARTLISSRLDGKRPGWASWRNGVPLSVAALACAACVSLLTDASRCSRGCSCAPLACSAVCASSTLRRHHLALPLNLFFLLPLRLHNPPHRSSNPLTHACCLRRAGRGHDSNTHANTRTRS